MEPTPSKNGVVEDYTTKLKAQNQKSYSDNFLNRQSSKKIIGNNKTQKLNTMKIKANFNQ
jgi:hypothetical protein